MAKRKKIKLSYNGIEKSFDIDVALRLLCPNFNTSVEYRIAESENLVFKDCEIRNEEGKLVAKSKEKNCNC